MCRGSTICQIMRDRTSITSRTPTVALSFHGSRCCWNRRRPTNQLSIQDSEWKKYEVIYSIVKSISAESLKRKQWTIIGMSIQSATLCLFFTVYVRKVSLMDFGRDHYTAVKSILFMYWGWCLCGHKKHLFKKQHKKHLCFQWFTLLILAFVSS